MSDSLERAAVYEFLGRFWMSEIDDNLFRNLVQPCDVRDAFLASGGKLSELDSDSAGIQVLAEDYCQMFLGPANHLPPYQSVWVEGQFAGEPSVAMRKWCEIVTYQSATIDADHLGVQMNVMARIVRANQSAMERDFFQCHLSWPSNLIRAAAERARTHFYKSIMRMTEEFLGVEGEQLAGHLE